jgi:hypothetical protein
MLKLVLTASAIYLAVFGIGFMFAHRETGLEAVPEMLVHLLIAVAFILAGRSSMRTQPR